MTSKSKAKGNAWERDVAKFLGDTLGGSFVRVQGSGAYIGGLNVVRKEVLSENQQRASKGDIAPPDHLKHLNIEAKHYKEISFSGILDGKCALLENWIDQTEIVADFDDLNLTIFKITRKGSWVVFSYDIIQRFKLETHVVYQKSDGTRYVICNYMKFFTDNTSTILHMGEFGIGTQSV